MADELRDAPFLGQRTINFVKSIIVSPSFSNNSGSGLSPVTNFEKKLLANQEKIREIDDELHHELVKLLEDAKDYIPPHTAMRVLLFGHGRHFLDQAYEIVYFAARDRMVLTDEEINTIVAELRKDPSSQVQWLMTLYAGDKAEELEVKRNSVKLPIDFQ